MESHNFEQRMATFNYTQQTADQTCGQDASQILKFALQLLRDAPRPVLTEAFHNPRIATALLFAREIMRANCMPIGPQFQRSMYDCMMDHGSVTYASPEFLCEGIAYGPAADQWPEASVNAWAEAYARAHLTPVPPVL